MSHLVLCVHFLSAKYVTISFAFNLYFSFTQWKLLLNFCQTNHFQMLQHVSKFVSRLRCIRINHERIFEIAARGKTEFMNLSTIWRGLQFFAEDLVLNPSVGHYVCRERRSQTCKRKTAALMDSPSKSPSVYSMLAFRQQILQLDVKHLHQRAIVTSWQSLCVYLFSNWKPGFKPK